MTSSPLPPLLAAARGERPSRIPVWFMRQAGRSLPEYRVVRGEGSILGAIAQPDLAAEITLQPVRRYGVDGAVMYSDIVVPATHDRLRHRRRARHRPGRRRAVPPATADLDRLRPYEPAVDAPYIAEAVRHVRAALPDEVVVLAFAGAPFTVASYLVEGRPSRTYQHTKALMHVDEPLWHSLMARLADQAIASIAAQLDAGAGAFQLFDSWAGALSDGDYQRYVQPHTGRVFGELRDRFPQAPGIHFGIGCDHLLESMCAPGPTVIGLDWRTRISAARRRLGADRAVQGNLDPALVLAGADVALAAADAVLDDNGGHPAHIFNLGHGVQPDTDPGVLAAVAARVHARSAG